MMNKTENPHKTDLTSCETVPINKITMWVTYINKYIFGCDIKIHEYSSINGTLGASAQNSPRQILARLVVTLKVGNQDKN